MTQKGIKMKLKWIIALAAMLAAMLAVSASADTIFLGGSVTNTASWDNGLPTSVGNPGIIGVNGSIPGGTLTGYYVTQTNGTVNNESFTGTAHTDGEWNVNGGTYTTRAMTLGGTHVFNVDGGTAKLGNNNRDVVLSGTSSLNVISGAIDFGRRLILNGGSFMMSGGTLTGDTDTWLGANSFNGGGLMNFNGGTATFAQLNFGDASTKAVFGGSSAGSVTIDSFLGTNMDIDWLTGTKMALSVTNVTDWAETLWNSGQLTYNGNGTNELSKSWAEVTAVGGLGGGENFSFDGETLTVVPEPAVMSLIVSAGLLMILFRRRMGR